MLMNNREEPNKNLFSLLGGYHITQALYVVAKLGVADLLTKEPKNSDYLSQELKVNNEALNRVLRYLVSVGVLAINKQNKFSLTAIGEPLRSDVTNSLRNFVIFHGEEPYYAFGSLLKNVQTGKPAFNQVFGKGHFEYLAENPEANTIFHKAMANTQQLSGDHFEDFDFSKAKKIIDVGGGNGTLLVNLLSKYSNLHGILFDLPGVVINKVDRLSNTDIKDRCEIIPGSMFNFIPEGGEVYILSRILHDWSDDQALTILQNCRKVVPKDGSLLIQDAIIPEGMLPPRRAHLDLMMLVMTGGKERTEKEWKQLLEKGGFSLYQAWKTDTNNDLIYAKPK